MMSSVARALSQGSSRRLRSWEAPCRCASNAAMASRPSTRSFEAVAATSRGAALSPVRIGRRVAVILRQSLDNLGHAGEEVTVAPGYARNFLVPTGRAAYATPAARAALKVVLPPEELRASARAREENMLRARVAEARLRFVRATNDGVSLYGSVTAADVVEALSGTSSAGLRKLGLREKHVRMPEGGVFKAVGAHTVDIEAKPGVWCSLRVDIVST